MPQKFWQRERAYRRRLLALSPLAALVVMLLTLTSDLVPFDQIERHLGWKGSLHILPEITIIPDEDRFESFEEERNLKSMTSLDVEVVSETGKAEGGVEVDKRDKKDDTTTHEDGSYLVKSHPVHTDIPYSQDYVILKMVQPEYPPQELEKGIEGEVTLEILVNAEGRVENAWILSTIGPKSFEEASLKAVKEFLFEPPRRNGKPMPMSIRFLIRFRIVG